LLGKADCGRWVVSKLIASATKYSFTLAAYCAMPDHLHVLPLACTPAADLLKFISYFKQKTAYRYQKEYAKKLWQPRYFEHILRRADDFGNVAVYIWSNPVRRKVCANAIDYPLSGSLTMDWKSRYQCLGEWSPPWRGDQKPPG
jgi:putative transposase